MHFCSGAVNKLASMSNRGYRFNTETLQYERKESSGLRRAGRMVLHLLISAAVGLVLMYFYTSIFDTPRSYRLTRAGDDLRTEIGMLERQVNSSLRQLEAIEHRDNNVYRVIFESDSIPSTVRRGGVGGAKSYADLEHIEGGDALIRLTESIDRLSWREYIQSKSFDEVAKLANEKEQFLRCMPAIQPVAIHELRRISSPFGYRYDPFTHRSKFHAGLDFVARPNTPIHATGDGVVVLAKRSGSGYGNQVVVDHGFGYSTRYAHLNRISVAVGESVKRGQVVGLMGSTGRSTGTHLHYEVLLKGQPINPIHYFADMTGEIYEEMIQHAEEMPALD
ncbi:MAG: peptidase M23 [Bacteroidetes bacterium]|nr:MAG: peptidase M23 [Bacteroidota bacterium]